jgi:LysM repeat protein
MPDQGRRSPARLLAPIALVLVAAACAVVVLSSTASDSGEQTSEGTSERRATQTSPRAGRERRPRRAFYVVKTDDTLDRIAAKTGVPVERLLELNPELDPLALVSGQRIKLRQ